MLVLVKPTVFISFNSGSKEFVDSLERSLSKGAHVLRFEDEVPNWGSFISFMDTISEQDFAVLVISDAYLKSYACMYEVVQAMKNPQWKEKTMFVLMPETKPYLDTEHLKYIKYWAEECDKLQTQIEALPNDSTKYFRDKLDKSIEIRDSIDKLLCSISDTNCPKIWDVIPDICEKVNMSRGTQFYLLMDDGKKTSLKNYMVLDALRTGDDMTVAELSAELGIPKSTMYRVVNKLVEMGEIEKEMAGSTTIYYLSA